MQKKAEKLKSPKFKKKLGKIKKTCYMLHVTYNRLNFSYSNYYMLHEMKVLTRYLCVR